MTDREVIRGGEQPEGGHELDDFDSQLVERLTALADSAPVNRPSLKDLQGRIQAREDARLVNRMKAGGLTLIQSCGFGHYYGGYESDSRITMRSQDSKGKIWSPEERHAMKMASIGGIVGVTATYAYTFSHYF